MKPKVRFLLWALLISVVLFLLRDWIGAAYRTFLLLMLSALLPASQTSVALGYESSLRVIPYLALLLATPRLGLPRLLAMALGGVAVFVAIDLAMVLVWQAPPAPEGQGRPEFAHLLTSLVWDMLGHWLLPFLLWFAAVCRQGGGLFTDSGEPFGRAAAKS